MIRPENPRRQSRPRRWVVGAVVLCVAVVGGLLGFFNSRGTLLPTHTAATNQPANTPTTTTYTVGEFGVAFTHPAAWTVTKNETGTGNERIVNVVLEGGSRGVTFVFVPPSFEGMIRESVSIVNETPQTVAGIQGARIKGRTAKDGSPIDLLLFQHRGTLIDLNGPGDLVTSIGATITLQ